MVDRRVTARLLRERIDRNVATGWFTAALAVLLVNDHVLKWGIGGPVTGKLSDFAGPVVVAGLAAVAIGRKWAVVATAVGFAALKTVPGVAEAVAPALGGVTRRDPLDLVGLIALVPLWAPPPADLWTRVQKQAPPKVRTALRWLLPAVAVVALGATSSPNPREVRSLATDGATVYAQIGVRGSYSPTDLTWAASTDGGRSWQPASAPDPAALAAMTRSASEACRPDGTCFRAGGAAVDLRTPGGVPTVVFGFSDDQVEMLRYRRAGSGTPVDQMFQQVLMAPPSLGGSVLVTASDQGVLVGHGGDWNLVAVAGITPTPIHGVIWPLKWASIALLASAPLSLVVISIRSMVRGGGGLRALGGAAGGALVALAIWSVGIAMGAIGLFTTQPPTLLAIALTGVAAATVALPFILVTHLSGGGATRQSAP